MSEPPPSENDAPRPVRYNGFWKALNDQVQKNQETIEALRQAEQKYRSIFEHSVGGIFQTTPDGRYISANLALARMYGYDSPADLIAALTDITHQLYIQPGRREEFIGLMRQQGTVSDFESEVFRSDGSIIWIAENARAVHDERTAELLYYEGMVQDITRRKRAEEARRQAEARKAAQYTVTRVLAEATNLRQAAGKIMRAICESVGWDVGHLCRVDVDASVLRCVDLWHAPELNVTAFAEATRCSAVTYGNGLAGRVWASGRATWLIDVLAEPGFRRAAQARDEGLHAAFAFPILIGDEVSGVMEFFSRHVREPDDDLLALLAALGAQLGQFIERERVADQLARYAEELRAKNTQMEADLDMARDIQQVFLTQQYPTLPKGVAPEESWLRFCHSYRPAATMSGDFFSLLPLSETEVGMFICDVVGHGLRAALVTAIVRGLVEELTPIAADAGRFLTEINRGLRAIFRQTETPMLASAFYLVLNIADGGIRFANAGHPHPFHVRRGAGVVEPLRFDHSHGPVLGVFENLDYLAARSVVSPHDLIVLFTDGVYEVELSKNEYFGEQRLAEAVGKRMGLPVEPLFAELLSEIQQTCVHKEFSDDVCLLGVEILRIGATKTGLKVA